MLHNTALLVIFVFRNYTQLSLSPGDPVPAGSGRRLADAKTAIAGTDDGRGEKTGGPVYPGRLSVNNSDVNCRRPWEFRCPLAGGCCIVYRGLTVEDSLMRLIAADRSGSTNLEPLGLVTARDWWKSWY